MGLKICKIISLGCTIGAAILGIISNQCSEKIDDYKITEKVQKEVTRQLNE